MNIVYIIWRIFFTIPKGEGFISLFLAMALLVVEISGMFEMFVHFHGMGKSIIPELPEIDEDLFPDIDVFIATYNEPIDLVQKTINGCLKMEYPDQKKVHIYVCDDGSRPEMKKVAEKMGVNYIEREEHEGAKAGNLNNAMSVTNSLLIATFDADMIPMHDFLMATVPYFLKNEQARKYRVPVEGEDESEIEDEFPKIGFIQTPQCFYNTDLFQFNLFSEERIPNEQDYFYRDIQVSKNASNTVIYGGSNTVLAREALDEVGGFFTNSITEDFATGMLIQSKQYRCYALNTVHAAGLSPDDLKSLIKQRERWGRGCIQTARRVNLLFRKGLTIGQKISYFSSITYWYMSIKRLVYIMCPIISAIFGTKILNCSPIELLIFWVPTYLLTNTTIKRFSNKIRNTRWTSIYDTAIFSALLPSVILETLCISKNKFSVTKKDKKKDNDSRYRLWISIPYIIYTVLSVIGISKTAIAVFIDQSIGEIVVLFWLCANLFTLIMALFFILGRVRYREDERYIANVDCNLEQGTFKKKTVTEDISEGGFSFMLDSPEYLNPRETLEAKFNMKAGKFTYKCTLEAKVVRVSKEKDKWRYSCKIDYKSLKGDKLDNWNAIVHDRIPTFPQAIGSHLGFYEDIEVNIKRRLQSSESYARKTARVDLDETIFINDDIKVNLLNFNYEYILVKNRDSRTLPINGEIKISNNIILELKLVRDLKDEVSINREIAYSEKNKKQIYAITNIEELMETLWIREDILKWVEEKSVYKKEIDKTILVKPNRDIAEDELDLIAYI